jgi:hypothetical protein
MLTDFGVAQIAREAPHLKPLLEHAYLRGIALDVQTRSCWRGHGGALLTAVPRGRDGHGIGR